MRSLAERHSGTVVRQWLNTAAVWAALRVAAGIARIVRASRGAGSAAAFGSDVADTRNRPRFIVFTSSLFQPP